MERWRSPPAATLTDGAETDPARRHALDGEGVGDGAASSGSSRLTRVGRRRTGATVWVVGLRPMIWLAVTTGSASEPVIERVISAAPSAMAVTVKVNGASAVADVDVNVTVSTAAPSEPVAWPGFRVTDVWLSAPVTSRGQAGEAEVVGRRLAADVLQLELEGRGDLGLDDLAARRPRNRA